jgi:asparagine synthase (glutamine-hydrolysing)
VCGIGGVLALGGRPPDPAWGATLANALGHRGPDGRGVWHDDRIVLAHARLAIIDVSHGGAQPMRSGDDRHVIVTNGEIYNHADLAPGLARRGVALRSRSDTEVLLESLALDGAAALEPMRGMFAFGLWDRDAGLLLLARDRLGKKPLLWTRTDEWFAFASEAAALMELPFVRRRLDRGTLPHWLSHLASPAPRTLIEGIRKLPPASWMRVAAGGSPGEPARWWRPPEPDPAARPDAAWFEGFDRELVEASRLRTVSDVPIGVFLSGGVDSNVVLEALHRSGHRPIRTFTLGFAGIEDERPLAEPGARRYADQHTALVIEPDLAHTIEPVLARFGDPLADSAVVTGALIAREAAKHVKVIVNGDGGDELFGGYARYPFAVRADAAARVPGGLALLRARAAGRPSSIAALAALGRGDHAGAAQRLAALWSPEEVAALLAAGAPPPEPIEPPPLPGARGRGLLDALFAWDTGVALPDDLLVKVDVASMAHGLENRSPLLDHRLFEHVARIPPARRASPRIGKPLLRRHARGRVDPAVLAARKRGFQLPLERWLAGPLRGWLEALVADDGVTAPLFRPGARRAELDAFFAGRGSDLAPYRLWALAALEFWARRFSIEVGR